MERKKLNMENVIRFGVFLLLAGLMAVSLLLLARTASAQTAPEDQKPASVRAGSTSVTPEVGALLTLTEEYTVTIPHETVYCNDNSLPLGVEKVLTRGVDGENLCTATVTYREGLELERTVTAQSMLTAPVTEIVAIGTAEPETVNPQSLPVITENTITLPTGEVLTYTGTMQVGATAYFCNPWDRGITATGTKARVGAIAVDPRVIPYGTRMFIVSNDGEYVYGIATAEDCGDPHFIGGRRIDLYYNTYEECIQFGYRECTVYFLGT